MTQKHRVFVGTTLIISVGLLLIASVFYCGEREWINGSGVLETQKQKNVFSFADFSKNDLKLDYDSEKAQKVIFYDECATYEITDGGTYIFSGELMGKILIRAEDNLVHLVLNGLSVKSAVGPALLVESASKVIITLADNSENEFRDSTEYDGYKQYQSCIFSKSDITINGNGIIYVYGNYKDGIRTKDYIKTKSTNIKIKCKRDGIRANDGIMISNSNILIECEGNGLRTRSIKKNKGFIDVGDSSISVIAGKRGLVAANGVAIYSSKCDIYGVISNMDYKGNTYIEEECLTDGN